MICCIKLKFTAVVIGKKNNEDFFCKMSLPKWGTAGLYIAVLSECLVLCKWQMITIISYGVCLAKLKSNGNRFHILAFNQQLIMTILIFRFCPVMQWAQWFFTCPTSGHTLCMMYTCIIDLQFQSGINCLLLPCNERSSILNSVEWCNKCILLSIWFLLIHVNTMYLKTKDLFIASPKKSSLSWKND